jgi:bacillithiol system protein YtxJ
MGFFSFGKKETAASMNWSRLENRADLEAAIEKSHIVPVLLFKHSTRCSISAMALHSVEQNWKDVNGRIEPYFLDLIAHRDISNLIEEKTGVLHQSPQAIVIKNGEVVYQASHNGIRIANMLKAVAE